MKKIKLISVLMTGIFTFSLFASAVLAVDAENNDNNTTATPIPSPFDKDSVGIVEGSLRLLRKDRNDFKNNKLEEIKENANILKEKASAKKKIIQARLEKIKQDKEAKRKAVLSRLIDIQIKQLENIKERAAKMPNIKEDLKANLSDKINEAISELEAEKIILQAITKPEDLKAFAKELKDSFKTKRDIVKAIVDAILASKADKTIDNAEGRLAELKAKIAELKVAGQDVSILESLLAVAEAKITAAAAKTGKKDFKEAINDLKEAYKNMKSIVEKTDSAE